MKKTFVVLLLAGVAVAAVATVRRDPLPIISIEEALDRAARGEFTQLLERTDRSELILTARDGDEYRIEWIANALERNAFVNELVRASPQPVLYTSRSGGDLFAWWRAMVWVIWALYLTVVVAVLDLVLLVRRTGRSWESPDVLWMLAILLLAPFGSVAWLVFGRSIRRRERDWRPPPTGPSEWRDHPSLDRD